MPNSCKTPSVTSCDTCAATTKSVDCSYNTCMSVVSLFDCCMPKVYEITDAHVLSVDCSGTLLSKRESEDSVPPHSEFEEH